MGSTETTHSLDVERSRSAQTFTMLMIAGFLTGCTVGPDFTRPAVPEVANYTAAPLPEHTASTSIALGGCPRIGKYAICQ